MTPTEFKTWFEGFCEGIGGTPTAEQFKMIKAKLATVREAPVSAPWVIPYAPRERDRWVIPPPYTPNTNPITCWSIS